MTGSRHAPLTPSDCDLRPFRDMPLDVGRLRDSALITHEDPEAIVAALLLWGSAWHQVPAASVPNDDRWLAKAAGYGRAVDSWMRVKDGALRGFVECSDGRLYHKTLAQKANEAWDRRIEYEWRKAGDRHRKAFPDKETRPPFPDIDQWKAGVRPTEPNGAGQAELPLDNRPVPPEEGEIPLENALKGNERRGNDRSLGVDANASTARDFAIPAETMAAFRKHRVKLKKPMTDRAEELLGMKLKHIFDEQGHDPTAVIEQSILNGWIGVFPLKEEEQSGRGNRNGSGAEPDRRSGLARAIDKRLGDRGPLGPE